MHIPCDHHKTCGDCFSPNKVLDLEATVRFAANALAYATECDLATLSGLLLLKSSSKSSIKRQRSICLKLLENCGAVYEWIDWGHAYRPKNHRVQDILDASGKGPVEKKTQPSVEKALDAWIAANHNS